MSLERKVARTVLDLSELAKSSVVSALAQARSEGKFQLSDKDMSVVADVVTNTLEATFRNGVSAVQRLFK